MMQNGEPSTTEDSPGEPREDLLEELKKLRTRLAGDQKVPAYVVFPDATLQAISRKLPRTLTELSRIPGVGEVKLARYGEAFLEAVREYTDGLSGMEDSQDEKNTL